MKFANRMLAAAALAAAALLPGAAGAQEYPSKAIRFLVPIAPGGLTDTLTRMLGQGLSAKLGQPVVVENRPGAGGIIGMEAAAKSAPDGYTIIMVYQGVASVNPVLYAKPPYVTLRDFVPVAQVATFPLVLVVNPEVGAKSAKEFIDLARAKPGAMNYGSAGNATTAHLSMELFKRSAGIDLVHVPYKGEAPALAEVMAGRVAGMFATLTVARPQLQAGKVRALGIATRERSGLAPDIPTIAESGLPGFEVNGWYGVLAPAGTPAPIVERLNRELNAVLREPEMRERMLKSGVEPQGTGVEAARKLIADETERWRQIITAAGIKAD